MSLRGTAPHNLQKGGETSRPPTSQDGGLFSFRGKGGQPGNTQKADYIHMHYIFLTKQQRGEVCILVLFGGLHNLEIGNKHVCGKRSTNSFPVRKCGKYLGKTLWRNSHDMWHMTHIDGTHSKNMNTWKQHTTKKTRQAKTQIEPSKTKHSTQ